MGRMGMAASSPPEDQPLTPQQLREALGQQAELDFLWDRLWTLHRSVAEDLDGALNDYVIELEYGTR